MLPKHFQDQEFYYNFAKNSQGLAVTKYINTDCIFNSSCYIDWNLSLDDRLD